MLFIRLKSITGTSAINYIDQSILSFRESRFNPASALIFNNRGRAYALNPKKRKLDSGKIKIYWACDSLEAQIRSVYKRCGLHGASSHSGRRSLVSNAIKNGRTLEQLAILLGHSNESTTLLYCDVDQKRLAYACSIAI